MYLRKLLYLRKIEIFAFAEKSQIIAFSKYIGFLVFARRIDLTSSFCFSQADKEITYPDFCENTVCWRGVLWKLGFYGIRWHGLPQMNLRKILEKLHFPANRIIHYLLSWQNLAIRDRIYILKIHVVTHCKSPKHATSRLVFAEVIACGQCICGNLDFAFAEKSQNAWFLLNSNNWRGSVREVTAPRSFWEGAQ